MKLEPTFVKSCKWLGAAALLGSVPSPALADMVLSQVIVDLQPNKPSHDDIEVWNSGNERIYVVAEPAEILAPGTPAQERLSNPDPAVTGILVTPQRLVLEPDERKVIRVSAVVPRGDLDRIYRITIKPVAGATNSDTTALKILVGYDALVLFRPAQVRGEVTATRVGKTIVFHNGSNTAQELFEGKQCDTSGKTCDALPSTRLYAGADWEQTLEYDTPVEYQVSFGNGSTLKRF